MAVSLDDTDRRPRVALLWRSGPAGRYAERLSPLAKELERLGAKSQAVVYDDDRIAQVGETLRRFDAVLVLRVDPITDGLDRSRSTRCCVRWPRPASSSVRTPT